MQSAISCISSVVYIYIFIHVTKHHVSIIFILLAFTSRYQCHVCGCIWVTLVLCVFGWLCDMVFSLCVVGFVGCFCVWVVD